MLALHRSFPGGVRATMPILDLDATSMQSRIDLASLMHWPPPLNEDEREEFRLVESALDRFDDLPPDKPLQVMAGDVQALLKTVKRDKTHHVAGREQAKKGLIAGEVLFAIYLMNRFKEHLPNVGSPEASMTKAMHVVSTHASSEDGVWGNGDKMRVSDSMAWTHWRSHKVVAHFWCAFSLFNFRDGKVVNVFAGDNFGPFIRAAAFFQEFGLGFQVTSVKLSDEVPELFRVWGVGAPPLKGTKGNFLLDPKESILIDDAQFPPRLQLRDITLETLRESRLWQGLSTYKPR